MGLRNYSYPFDWLLSDWKGVENAIKYHFPNFLDPDFLYQSKKYPAVYKNMNQDLTFVHDFDKYTPLDQQLEFVQEKYKRRIIRFFQDIKDPTLFIRYINTDNGRDEIDYLEKNIDMIKSMIKSFNSDNDILFIANNDFKSNILDIYYVKKDENDTVARHPFDKNDTLLRDMKDIYIPSKEQNLKFYSLKQKRQKKDRIKKVVIKGYKKIFKKVYIHDKWYQ